MKRSSPLALAAVVTAATSLARAQNCENGRPTDPGGAQGITYGTAEVAYYDSSSRRARIHYALAGVNAPPRASTLVSGVPDAIVVAAEAADSALERFAALSYTPLLGDGDSPCASNGGSDAVDVYVLNFAAADGQALFDHCQAGPPLVCSGFVLVENDFRNGGYADAAEGMRTVVPHELFHLVQDAYDSSVERWWAEGSAQWAAKQVYPDLLDLERFLPAYFESPWRPLNVPPTGVVASFLYATAIWPVFLAERFDAALVREVYEGLEAAEGNVLTATDAALRARGGDLGSAFLEFAQYNAATGSRSPSRGGYAQASSYPEIELTTAASVGNGDTFSEVLSGFGAFYYSLHADSRLALSLAADPARVAAVLVPVVDGRAQLDAAQPLPTSWEGDGIVVVAGQSQARTDAPFTLELRAPTAGEDPGATDPSGCALGRRTVHGSSGTGVWLGIVVSLLGRLRARRSPSRKDS